MVFIYTFMHLLKLESFQDNVVRYIVGILTHKKGEKEDNSDQAFLAPATSSARAVGGPFDRVARLTKRSKVIYSPEHCFKH